MKSELIGIKETKIEYPCLMEYIPQKLNQKTFIVLFSSDGVGFVVYKDIDDIDINIGIGSSVWIMNQFK